MLYRYNVYLPTHTPCYNQETDVDVGKDHQWNSIQQPEYDVKNRDVTAIDLAGNDSLVTTPASHEFIQRQIWSWEKGRRNANKHEIHDQVEHTKSLDCRETDKPEWVRNGQVTLKIHKRDVIYRTEHHEGSYGGY